MCFIFLILATRTKLATVSTDENTFSSVAIWSQLNPRDGSRNRGNYHRQVVSTSLSLSKPQTCRRQRNLSPPDEPLIASMQSPTGSATSTISRATHTGIFIYQAELASMVVLSWAAGQPEPPSSPVVAVSPPPSLPPKPPKPPSPAPSSETKGFLQRTLVCPIC
ncbi:hypothetical protein BR93DRAFT_13841 [Coniochaeta sp. PMI_546]|nr:hypothetical protein BR93DRAFT_13841 [Coniochaeta sp. PMI_546]